MPSISLLIKPASGLCNMHCDYCFYCDEVTNRKQASYGLMTEQTLKKVIRKTVLKAENMCTIAFQGGEPTLCGLPFFEKVIEFVNQYNRNHIRIDYALQTNGYGITKEWCEFFVKHHFLLGISVDGLQSIHDTYRHGKEDEPTYERILHTIEMFEEYHVEYNVLTVIHRETAEHIKDIYREYRKHGWNYMQFITCLDPLGAVRGQQPYSLLPETYGRFLMDLFDLWYEDYRKGDAPYIRQFENYIGILLGYPPESCEQCGVCGMQYVVEADGSVYPCDFYALDEWNLGNLNQERLEDVDKKRQQLGFVQRSKNHPENCQSCKWFSLCRGGCYRSRMTELEGDTQMNYFCQGYQMFFEHCHERMVGIAQTLR